MKKEDFLNIELKGISQVYVGKKHCCRCGCGGTYTSTSFMNGARSKVNDKKVQKLLDEGKELVRNGATFDIEPTYIDISYGEYANGEEKALTFYFDDLK